jgi:hypothetical protein
MSSHFELTTVYPTISHANRQADTASRLVSRATKVMIICLAVLWNGQLLAETDDGPTAGPGPSRYCRTRSLGVFFMCLFIKPIILQRKRHCSSGQTERP